MYNIQRGKDKPDIAYLESRVKEMMVSGIRVEDSDNLLSLFEETKDALANELKQDYGIANPNSSQQIAYYLKSLGPEVEAKCTVNGKMTSNKEVLTVLAEDGIRAAEAILQYRKSKKYVDSIKTMLSNAENGLVHPEVTLSKTNRINYSGPALMNIPKKLLWAVIKPKKAGNKLWSADIKNQEPNILINIINAQSLKPALNSPMGLYEYMYSLCFKTRVKGLVVFHEKAIQGYMDADKCGKLPNVTAYETNPISPSVQTLIDGNIIECIDTTAIVWPFGQGNPVLPREVKAYTSNDEIKVSVEWAKDSLDNNRIKSEALFIGKFTLPDELVDPKWEGVENGGYGNGIVMMIDGIALGTETPCIGQNRREFKTAWNAMTYGSAKPGIVSRCSEIDGNTVYDFFHNIPEIEKYQKICKSNARKNLTTLNTYFGTVLQAYEPNQAKRARMFMDLPIQGTGSDLLSLLVKHFDEETARIGLSDKLWVYYTRHDELIIEVDGRWQAEVGEGKVESIIREILEHRVDDWEPFKLEVGMVTSNLEDIIGEQDTDDEME